MPDASINHGTAACEADMLPTKLPRPVDHENENKKICLSDLKVAMLCLRINLIPSLVF